MIEIINKQKFPVQLIVRSKKRARAFTTLIIPGKGKGHNRIVIDDEAKTEYVDRAESYGFISTRQMTYKQIGA